MDQGKPKSGMRLRHYTLTVKLSEGLFSETWLAEHAYLENKEICLKIFTNEKFCNFLSKQQSLVVVKDSQYFPNVEDYDPTSTPPYIAEEVVAGRSLRQLLRSQKKFAPEAACELLTKIMEALRKLHEQNIAHLDIRPEHLILDDKGNVKLLDYLIGRVTTLTLADYYREFTTKAISMERPLMRSLLYKPKRQRIGAELSIQSDIFALGILLFELVTGTYPNRKAMLPSAIIPNLPPKVDQIYAQCCGREENTFENCQEILDAIQVKENVNDIIAAVPGVQLITDNIAMASINALGGNKNYVDGKNVLVLSKNLETILSSPLRFLVFDFRGIDYLNSSAIGFLVSLSDRIQNKSGATVMCNVDKKVLTILSALGLEKVMKIVDSLEEAERYLKGLVAR